MKQLWKIGLAVVAMFALGAAAVGFVSAQTGDGVPVPGTERISNFIGRLAENLGISQDELEAAIDETQLEIVDEKLADGTLTEEQAAEARERIESGQPGFGFKMRHGHQRGLHGGADVAEFLGITVDELRAAVADEGQSLAQVAKANGSSAEELSAFLLGELETRLAEAVESGKIDQAKADEILANAGERIDEMINREGLPGKSHDGTAGGFPGRFRSGGHGPFPGGASDGGFGFPGGFPAPELEETSSTIF